MTVEAQRCCASCGRFWEKWRISSSLRMAVDAVFQFIGALVV